MITHRVSLIGFLTAAWSLAPLTAATVGGLRCESLENPLGIDAKEPRLSWIQQSDEPGARQSAWQVLAASSTDLLEPGKADLWDSGKTDSDQSAHVRYGGKALGSRQRVHWKVRVWDKDGRPGPWSPAASWSMAIQPEDWQARWIGLVTPEQRTPLESCEWIAPPDAQGPSPMSATVRFRHRFDIPPGRAIRSAELFLAINGKVGSIINGKPHSGGEGWRDAVMIDLAPHLKAGANELILTVSVSPDAPFRNPAIAGRGWIHFDGGNPIEFASGGGWEWAPVAAEEWRPVRAVAAIGQAPWGPCMMPANRRLPARLLRREFDLVGAPRRATLYVSGLGLSECFINGHKVGDEVLSPALSDYDKRVPVVVHDVTGMVTKGANAIGIHLGNGRFHSPRSRWYVMSRDFGQPRVRARLEFEMSDGTTTAVVTDDSWKVTDGGPVRANNEFDGEEYDARLECDGWTSAGFNDSPWPAATLMDPPKGEHRSVRAMCPIRVTQTLRPISVREPQPGVFVFDMGQNMVGWCRLHVNGPRGATVRMRHAETLRPDGGLFLANMRTAEVTDVYHLKGGGPETYEPRFTYHGFRYVEVTGFPGKPSLDSIEGRVVHDDLPVAGSFHCSDPRINRLVSNIRWGLRGNYRSLPTDCPQRDERQGWLGDRTFSSRGETYLFDTSALYSKWMQDVEDSMREDGALSDVCPNYWPIYSDNVSWPSAFIEIPGMIHEQSGDEGAIRRHYPAMKRWIDRMEGFVENGLTSRDNYGDWCVPPEDPQLIHSTDPARRTDGTLVASAFRCHNLKRMAGYARLLGLRDDAARFDTLAASGTEAFNRRFFDPARGWYDNGTQTSCVLPLAFGLVPASRRADVFARLTDNITHTTAGHIGTGLVGGQWLNRVLTQGGRADLVHGFVTAETYPSWGYMASQGATTIWELWNGDTANPAMNSGNHLMLAGDSLIWLFECLAGIKPDPSAPGFKHIILKPHPVGDIRQVRASHHSPFGEIVSDWSRDDVSFRWQITVPPNTTATVMVPGTDPSRLSESGQPVATRPEWKAEASADGRIVLQLGAGSYRFSYQ